MVSLNPKEVITSVPLAALIGLASISAIMLLVQKANVLGEMTTSILAIDGPSLSINNISNVTLGDLFYVAKSLAETHNPINDTDTEKSYVYNVLLLPPNSAGTTGNAIKATETGKFTIHNLTNGLTINQGQGLIITENHSGQQENATATFVSLSHINPDGLRSATSVVFFNTNSTGELAFLNNKVGIAQVEFSPEGTIVRIWEWKSGPLPL